MQREKKDTHIHIWALHTKTETNRREQQTEIQREADSSSLTVNHSSLYLHPAAAPPSNPVWISGWCRRAQPS